MKMRIFVLFIGVNAGSFSLSLLACAQLFEQDKSITQFDQEICTEYICSDQYNEFDSLADEMVQKGIEPVQPQKVSRAMICLRKFGGYILLGYFAAKGYIKNAWHYLTAKKARKHS